MVILLVLVIRLMSCWWSLLVNFFCVWVCFCLGVIWMKMFVLLVFCWLFLVIVVKVLSICGFLWRRVLMWWFIVLVICRGVLIGILMLMLNLFWFLVVKNLNGSVEVMLYFLMMVVVVRDSVIYLCCMVLVRMWLYVLFKWLRLWLRVVESWFCVWLVVSMWFVSMGVSVRVKRFEM